VIDGLEVRLDWYLDSTANTNSMSVELSWNGGTTWTTAQTDTVESTVEHTTTLGGPADNWGHTWDVTAGELSATNFMVRITSNSNNFGRDFYLDWVPVRVYSHTPVIYTITATAGTGGTITPSGVVNVSGGSNQTFDIVPNATYIVAGVSVDGGASVGRVNHYTFTNVAADHTIDATFDGGWSAPSAFSDPDNDVGAQGNVYTSNDGYATINSTNDDVNYRNFGFSLPSGATIDGIEVAIEGYSTGTRNADVALSWDNGASITTFNTTAMPSTTSAAEATVILGGPANTWGRTWLDSEFADGSFAVRVEGTGGGGSTLYIDQLQVKVYYTVPNTMPTVTTPIADVNVLEDAANTVFSLYPNFQDAEDTDAQLTYAVTGNTNPGLFTSVDITDPTNFTLDYAPDANGTANITVRATDTGLLFVEDTFLVTVTAVNDAPSFTKGVDQTVLEDAGPQTVAGWATAISAGPADESVQTLTFNVTGNTNPGLFSAGPAGASNGTLTYTPAANANGSATITITLSDNGGTANGGVDTSASQTFVINVTAVNDAPSFTASNPPTVPVNAGAQTVNPWATFNPGPNEAGQNVLQYNISGSTCGTLLSAGPSVSIAGTLTYTPGTDQVGACTFDVTVQDDGGTTNGGVDTSSPAQTFTISVDAPVITLSPATLPDGILAFAYSQTITASGGTGTYTFAVTAGTLPTGLTLSSAGVLSGSPIALGTFNFTVTATDSSGGSGPFMGSQAYSITINNGMSVTIDQDAGQADPTNISPINFTVVFSAVTTDFATGDVTLSGTAGATTAIVTGSGTTYNVAVSGMTSNGTVIAEIDAGVATDAGGNPNNASTSTDNTVTYDLGNPVVVSTTLVASYTGTGPGSFAVTFNKDVSDPAGSTDTDDVTNPANYLLINKGVNGVANTVSCVGGVVADDTLVTVTSVAYDNAAFTSNVTLVAPLPVGSYRLFVCGTTSIVDLAGNLLNGGADYTFDFAVNSARAATAGLPATGFAPGMVTNLPAQPASMVYASTDLWLEIPSLNIKMSIVGVPKTNEGWNVSWLNHDAGWLNGSAFPTWNGNSVITGHVWDAFNRPGPFVNLKNLRYGDQIKIHAFGQVYTYEIRESKAILPTSISTVFKHEENSWITLVTCEDYKESTQTYLYRRMVRAVLVSVTGE